MQYKVEELSETQRKVEITVSAKEVDLSVSSIVDGYRKSMKLDGFRKGKAPATLVEKRFRAEVYHDASGEIINNSLAKVFEETGLDPISKMEFTAGDLNRKKDFVFSVSFEVLPKIELPVCENIECEQEDVIIDDKEVEDVLVRLQDNLSSLEPIAEPRPAQDGDIATIDFIVYDQDKNKIPGLEGKNFQLALGVNQSLPEFENIVRGMTLGEEKEGPVTFPQDFFNAEYAGKSYIFSVTLTDIQEKRKPELDDDFAKKAGNVQNMEALRESIKDSFTKSRVEMNKALAQQKILDSVLKLVDFPLPVSMVENAVRNSVEEQKYLLEREGKIEEFNAKSAEEWAESLRPAAEERVKGQIFLLSLAEKKELKVADEEIELELRRIAAQSRQDLAALRKYYIENNLIYALRDRLLIEKAINYLYENAKITLVSPEKAEPVTKKAKSAKGSKAS